MKDQRYHQYTMTAIIVNIIERSQFHRHTADTVQEVAAYGIINIIN